MGAQAVGKMQMVQPHAPFPCGRQTRAFFRLSVPIWNIEHEYLDWFADKVIRQAVSPSEGGSVLETACNDGSQLDKFKATGWKTFGVDPAANLVPFAVEKGHDVKVGFWGMPDISPPEALPSQEKLHAIVAWNVFAHVGAPVDFLEASAALMGENTKFYIQTSQCQNAPRGRVRHGLPRTRQFLHGFTLSNMRLSWQICASRTSN